MNPLFEIHNLTFGYNGDTVLKNVSFTVHRGDCAAIIGGNGAGKSTLMKLLLHELSPEQGEILIDGKPAAEFNQWYKIGYVPQNCFSVMDRFPASVEEVVGAGLYHQVGLFRRLSSSARGVVSQTLESVGLQDMAKTPVNRLSGGQQQRTLIARALAAQPEALLLDEPTSGVDPAATESLFSLLKRIRQDYPLTILMISHDHQRVSESFNPIFCLENGTLVELDAHQLQEELHHKHKHPEIPDDSGIFEHKGEDNGSL